MNNIAVKEDLSKWPWGTLLAVIATIVLCLTSAFASDKLGYDDLSTMIVLAWGAMALGRGFAAKADPVVYDEYGPITRFVNKFNWATVGVAAFAVAGYIIQLGPTPMSWGEYGNKIGILAGALVIGRGVAVLKKDVTTGTVPIGGPDDIGTEISDDNLGDVSSAAGVPSEPLPDEEPNMPLGFDTSAEGGDSEPV